MSFGQQRDSKQSCLMFSTCVAGGCFEGSRALPGFVPLDNLSHAARQHRTWDAEHGLEM